MTDAQEEFMGQGYTLHGDALDPPARRLVLLDDIPDLQRLGRRKPERVALETHHGAGRIVEPDPGRDARGRGDGESTCMIAVRERETGIDEGGVFEGGGVEPVFVGERARADGVRQLAMGCQGHVQDCIAGRVIAEESGDVSLEQVGGINGAYGEGDGRRRCEVELLPGPVVPDEMCGAVDGLPKIRGGIDAEVARGTVIVGCDDHGFVDILGNVVYHFPSTVVLDRCPGWCNPDILSSTSDDADVNCVAGSAYL
nr:hypothetical protein CFP56_00155 [Quercus suber]